ncbi:MAG: PrkA family serine protein kinase [Halobacteriales archaeon]
MDGQSYLRDADRDLEDTYEEPISLAEYVDRLLETPTIGSHASRYLLSAIEAAGTRTVIEKGEEKERYRFFDDPENDGEHAVLGNTDVLNDFVSDLRSIAAGRGNDESIIWFSGPTATGKSELKRCLVNGLRGFSKTPAGKRYTVEWNLTEGGERGLTYGDAAADDKDDWHRSPVQANPLSVFPSEVRDDILDDLAERLGDDVPIRLDTGLDPFSREAYDELAERYREQDVPELFSAVTDRRHLRVTNYVVDVGQGIGVLHPEDVGGPKERLVGAWMPEMLRELDSRGRKNPQAFSYDGVLSQGNAGITVIEDAAQHADLLGKLLNVSDEGRVKLDKAIGMDIDTQLIVISNPDLDAQLDQGAERGGEDPLKALKRRLTKHEVGYLTELGLEVELLRRELTGDRSVRIDADAGGEPIDDESVAVDVHEADRTVRREFAPHALEAAALYDVVTRLDSEDLPDGLDLVEKALLFDRGYVEVDGERRDVEAFSFDPDASDGDHGIPMTYTRDVLADLLGSGTDRTHPDLPVGDVIMPADVLEAMVDRLGSAPVFASGERREFETRVTAVREHVFDRQETDVLEAMLAEHRPDEETVAEYVEHVTAWTTDEQVDTDRGPIDPDPLTMKVFEIEHLGRFSEGDYIGTEPTGAVKQFRREEITTALNRRAWEQRSEGFEAGEVDLTAVPVLQEVLAENDWDDVRRAFEDLAPRQWEDPPSGTETERVKEATLSRMADRGYSRASAELTSRRVMREIAEEWT